MRFEVPQFIDIEDKIFGPFTWRQFVYLGGGVGAAVVLFLTTPFLVAVMVGLPIGLLAGALAFFPVNNRPFSYFLEAIWNYVTTTKLYKWKHNADMVYKKNEEVAPTVSVTQRATTHQNITSLTRKLELQALQQ